MTPEDRESAAKAIEAEGRDLVVRTAWDEGYELGLDRAASIVRAHPVASPWIRVEDRLPLASDYYATPPVKGERVLGWYGDHARTCYLSVQDGWEQDGWLGMEPASHEPTHWCPLPPPPEP